MSKNVWLYFGEGSRNLMVPSSRLKGMYPASDGTLELSFDSIVNTNNSPTDKAILNLFEDNTHRDVIKAIGRAMHNETPTFNGFITVADETTSAGFHVPEFLTEHDGTEKGTIVSVDSLIIQDATLSILTSTADGSAWAGGTTTPGSGHYWTIATDAAHVIHLPIYSLGAIVEYVLISGTTGYSLRTYANSGSNEKINGIGGSVSATIPPYAKRVRAIGVLGGWEVNFYNELGYIDSVGNGFDAPDLTNIDGEDIDIVATLGSINLTATENAADSIVINSTIGGIDITAAGASAGEDINIEATGSSVHLKSTEDTTNAIQLWATAGGINVAATGEAGQDINIKNTGGSVYIDSTEQVGDSIRLLSALGGIDITSALGGAGNDIDIHAGTSSVNITSAENVGDAIVLNASAGGIAIGATGEAGQNIDIVNTGGSINLQATESATDAITIISTLGGIDILASGAAAGEDIDITATGSSINLESTEASANAITLNASNAAGGIDITANGNIDITGAPVNIANRKDELSVLSTITDSSITVSYGTEYIVNDGNGGAIVLPNAAVGKRITIILGTIIGSNTLTITALAGDLLKGYAIMEATDAANNKTLFQPDGTNDLIITLDGDTTGGLVGDKIELTGISSTEWRVRATLSHTNSAANPFS